MHVTLAQYNSLTPEEKAQVTSIDASIVEDASVSSPSTSHDAWDDLTCGSIPNPEYGQ